MLRIRRHLIGEVTASSPADVASEKVTGVEILGDQGTLRPPKPVDPSCGDDRVAVSAPVGTSALVQHVLRFALRQGAQIDRGSAGPSRLNGRLHLVVARWTGWADAAIGPVVAGRQDDRGGDHRGCRSDRQRAARARGPHPMSVAILPRPCQQLRRLHRKRPPLVVGCPHQSVV